MLVKRNPCQLRRNFQSWRHLQRRDNSAVSSECTFKSYCHPQARGRPSRNLSGRPVPYKKVLNDFKEDAMNAILFVLLILLLVGALPTWPYSANWGYYPSGGVGLILLIMLVLLLSGRRSAV